MLLINLLIGATMAAVVALSPRVLSPQELQDDFEQGQKLYALGDYAKAIEHYEEILATKDTPLLKVEDVTVTVDEYILPVSVAARYQLANTHNKLGMEKLQRHKFLLAEGKKEEAEERYNEALADLKTSLSHFQKIREDERIDERTRVMAQYQILETGYQLKRYEEVIDEGERLLRQFPDSIYETAVYYDMGWSYFELGRYRDAIERLRQVLLLSPRGSHADRALYQIAECYDQLEEHDEALKYLDRLISRYDFSDMSEREIIEMNTMKLRGLVQETSRELVAKAQVKRGDIYAQLGDTEAALAAYAVVPEQYAAEKALVHTSYIRSAELLLKTRGPQAAIDAYKNAIEEVDDAPFQAESQLAVARLLFENGEYAKSADEYRIYLNAYADVADRIGFQQDKVIFRLAQCYQFDGREKLSVDPPAAQALLKRATDTYDQLLTEHPGSALVPDALFGLGFSRQLLGLGPAAVTTYRRLIQEFPDHPATPGAVAQLARVQYEAGQYTEAIATYRSLLDRYPGSEVVNTARMELGLAYRRVGDREAAIAALRQVEPDWGQWSRVQLELAELLSAGGDYAQAQEVLDRALAATDASELSSKLHYAKGKAYFSAGEYSQTIHELSDALDLAPSAKIVSSSLLTRGAAYYEVAKQLDAAGDTAQARVDYVACLNDLQRLLKGEPEMHIKDRAFRTLGATMIRLGRGPEAVEYYRQIIAASQDPHERATYQMLLTELFYDLQDYDKAQTFGRQLLDMEFEDDNEAGYYRKERAYSIIGSALLQQKRFDEAAAVFAEGLKRYPDSGESANMSFSQGLAQFSAGEYELAAATFRDYLRRFPQDHNAVHGQYYLAYSLQSLTEFGDAARAFQKLVTRFPRSAYKEEALFLVAENYFNEQSFPDAVQAYHAYLKAYPHGAHADVAQYGQAWAHFEQEEMKPGLEAMTDLVAQFPSSPLASKALFTIGDFYYNAKDYEQALAAYTRVAEQYPDSDEARKTPNLIAELREIRASLEYAEVMKLFDERDYRGALQGFQRIVERYPGTYTELAAYSNMAMVYETRRQWADAAATYSKVLEKAGDAPQNSDVVSFARQHRDWITENRL